MTHLKINMEEFTAACKSARARAKGAGMDGGFSSIIHKMDILDYFEEAHEQASAPCFVTDADIESRLFGASLAVNWDHRASEKQVKYLARLISENGTEADVYHAMRTNQLTKSGASRQIEIFKSA